MMMLLHMDCGRSKLSLLEADPILLRNLDFEDMYATTVVQKVVFHHKVHMFGLILPQKRARGIVLNQVELGLFGH